MCSVAAFLVSVEYSASVLVFSLPIGFRPCAGGFASRRPYILGRTFLRPGRIFHLRPRFPHTPIGSTGISTCCPSPTPCGLGLGPDLPREDEPSPGNLGFSTARILTALSLLIPAFSLPFRPHVLPVMLLPHGTLPYQSVLMYGFRGFGTRFSPVNLRRRPTRLVSCYALFE